MTYLFIIEQKHELLARETFFRQTLNRSEDMSEEMKVCYIEYLADEVYKSNLEKEAMKLVLEDFLQRQKEQEEELSLLKKSQAEMKAQLDQETKDRQRAERKASELAAKLNYANKNRFGSKRQNVKKEEGKDKEQSDREKEKEDFNGTDDSLSTGAVPVKPDMESSETPEPSRKERAYPIVRRAIRPAISHKRDILR